MRDKKIVRQISLKNLKPTESVIGAQVKIAEIKLIIEKEGWFGQAAIAIRDEIDETVYLLDGHHRFAAAQEAGLSEIPVIMAEFSELSKFHLYYNSIEEIRRAARNVRRFM